MGRGGAWGARDWANFHHRQGIFVGLCPFRHLSGSKRARNNGWERKFLAQAAGKVHSWEVGGELVRDEKLVRKQMFFRVGQEAKGRHRQ